MNDRRLVQETEIMIKISRVIGSTLDIERVYEAFALETRTLIRFDQLCINTISSDGNESTVAYTWGLDIPGLRKGDKSDLTVSMGAAVVTQRKGMYRCFRDANDFYRQFPHAGAKFAGASGILSIICVPLISGDRAIGTFHFRSRERNAYAEQDLALAERVGQQIAGAIANAQLYARLAQSEAELRVSKERSDRLSRELEIISEITRKINSTLNLEDVYERLATEARRLIDYDRMVVSLIDVTAGTVTIQYVAGKDFPSRRPGNSFSLLGSCAKELCENCSGIIIQAENESAMSRIYPYTSGLQVGILSMLSVPLLSQGNVIGSLNFRSLKPNLYTEIDLRLAEGLGREITGAIANAKLYSDLDQLNRTLESRVNERTTELAEMNAALRVLLKKGEQDLVSQERDFISNINHLVIPFLEKMKLCNSLDQQQSLARIVAANLSNISSRFLNRLASPSSHEYLTPTEMQVAIMIKNGLSSKEIAKNIGISVGTVVTHRNKIRKKLNLTSRNVNLRSHLLFLS